MAFHAVTGRRMVEVYDNIGAFVAGIYPDEATNGIKIVSKHIVGYNHDDGETSVPPVPSWTIEFRRS